MRKLVVKCNRNLCIFSGNNFGLKGKVFSSSGMREYFKAETRMAFRDNKHRHMQYKLYISKHTPQSPCWLADEIEHNLSTAPLGGSRKISLYIKCF